MAYSNSSKPYFYKVFMDITAHKLALPEGFTQKHSQLLSHKAKLEIESGSSWDVSVEKSQEEEGVYFFTQGWTKFSQDMCLEPLELLVFAFVGNSMFRVTVFTASSFEKDSNYRVRRNPRCWISLKPYNRARLRLHKDFIEATGLIREEKVRVEYVGGTCKEVMLYKIASIGVALGRGWTGFCNANGLSDGGIYSLEFIPSTKVIRIEPA